MNGALTNKVEERIGSAAAREGFDLSELDADPLGLDPLLSYPHFNSLYVGTAEDAWKSKRTRVCYVRLSLQPVGDRLPLEGFQDTLHEAEEVNTRCSFRETRPTLDKVDIRRWT